MPTFQISKNLTRMRTTKRERVSLILKTKTSAYKRRRRVGMGVMTNEEVLVDVTDSPVIPAFCSSEEDEETPLDWLTYAPEVEEPEESGWGQLEPALNELPSNKQACKDDGDKGEESASMRPHPLTVDVMLPEPVNEVVQVTETRRRRRGEEELIKKQEVSVSFATLSLSYYNCHQIL